MCKKLQRLNFFFPVILELKTENTHPEKKNPSNVYILSNKKVLWSIKNHEEKKLNFFFK